MCHQQPVFEPNTDKGQGEINISWIDIELANIWQQLVALANCTTYDNVSNFSLKWLYIYIRSYSWIAPQVDTRKNWIASERKGLQQIQDHEWKALDEKNADLGDLFLCDLYWP